MMFILFSLFIHHKFTTQCGPDVFDQPEVNTSNRSFSSSRQPPMNKTSVHSVFKFEKHIQIIHINYHDDINALTRGHAYDHCARVLTPATRARRLSGQCTTVSQPERHKISNLKYTIREERLAKSEQIVTPLSTAVMASRPDNMCFTLCSPGPTTLVADF